MQFKNLVPGRLYLYKRGSDNQNLLRYIKEVDKAFVFVQDDLKSKDHGLSKYLSDIQVEENLEELPLEFLFNALAEIEDSVVGLWAINRKQYLELNNRFKEYSLELRRRGQEYHRGYY